MNIYYYSKLIKPFLRVIKSPNFLSHLSLVLGMTGDSSHVKNVSHHIISASNSKHLCATPTYIRDYSPHIIFSLFRMPHMSFMHGCSLT
jgi:hypothetical protein